MGFSPLTDVILPTNKYSSRHGRNITRAIIHNWHGMYGGIERLVYSSDQASSNYIILSVSYKMPRAGRRLNGTTVPAGTVLPAGTIIGSVDENYRAWTSGSQAADGNSITFEIQNDVTDGSGRISKAAWNSSVRLLADIANRYRWGTLKFGTTVRGHKEFQSTSCPGKYLWPRMSSLASQAQAARKGGTPSAPKPSTPVTNYNKGGYSAAYVKDIQKRLVTRNYDIGKAGVDGSLGKDTFNAIKRFQKANGLVQDGIPGPKTLAKLRATPATPGATTLVEDGLFGPASTRRLQQVLGTKVTGQIGGQRAVNRKRHANMKSLYYKASGNSAAILALQKKLGIDYKGGPGQFGPATIKAWQRKLGVTADGYFGPETAKAAQRALNRGKLW